MRIAALADSHFDSTSGGRLEECVRIHDWIVDDCKARQVDLILHGGDVFERASTPSERLAVYRFFQRAADVAPVVVVRGNHDRFDELAPLAQLRAEHRIIVEQGAGVHSVAGAHVAALAWPSRSAILSMPGVDSHALGELVAGDALRHVMLGLGAELDGLPPAPRILLTHAMVRGSVTSVGQPLVGCDLELGLDDLALVRADFSVLGHIHKPQDWAGPIAYPGSPRRTSFGETGSKGYLLIEFDARHQLRSWERIATPCAPMLLLTASWVDGELMATQLAGTLDRAEVRLRYSVPADQRALAKAAAQRLREQMLGAGAVRVQVEEQVEATSAARAPAVASASTLADKLRALWAAQCNVPAEERAAALLRNATLLEGER